MDDWGPVAGAVDPWGADTAGAGTAAVDTWHDEGFDTGKSAGDSFNPGATEVEAYVYSEDPDADGGAKFNQDDSGFEETGARDDKCFGCGESGHRRADCPNPSEVTCRYCKQAGHFIKDCPDKPPMVCKNCGEEGHMQKDCESARKINRDHIADVDAEVAWEKIKQAAAERDIDDAKEGVEEYVKALNGGITYRELQEALIQQEINLWLIATERPLLPVFTNMDFQGNMGKKYSVSYRFTEKAGRPREAEGWPKDRDEILSRLDDAGEVVNSGQPFCQNCREIGHVSKHCTVEKTEATDAPKISCYNCGEDGHRVRDCPQPRIDKFACKNCGESGHKAADCEAPPNPTNVECHKCNEIGHFSKDCPQGGGRACRNCGQEGHMAKECDQPRNMDNVTCRNCEQAGHFSRDCPQPKDWSKVQCSNCQEYGHTKVRCKKPPMDGDDFDFEASDATAIADSVAFFSGTKPADTRAQPADDGQWEGEHGGSSGDDFNSGGW